MLDTFETDILTLRRIVCMYLMIGKGQIAKKDHIGAKIDVRVKFMGKYNCPVVFWQLGDPVPMLLQEVSGSST